MTRIHRHPDGQQAKKFAKPTLHLKVSDMPATLLS
jgi:hypothetical protein